MTHSTTSIDIMSLQGAYANLHTDHERDYFFFFQAEDGIRDKLVTGVQTCALPIYPVLSRPIPLAGYMTVTPFVGGRATAYSKTVTWTHNPLAGGPAVEDTKDDPRVRELLEFGADGESRASRVYALDGGGGVRRMLPSIAP